MASGALRRADRDGWLRSIAVLPLAEAIHLHRHSLKAGVLRSSAGASDSSVKDGSRRPRQRSPHFPFGGPGRGSSSLMLPWKGLSVGQSPSSVVRKAPASSARSRADES
jgi:hypothetical protein